MAHAKPPIGRASVEIETPDIIYEDRDRRLVLRCQRTCPPALVALWERIEWGTQGVLYTMPSIAQSIADMSEPYFLTLDEEGELVGGYAFNRTLVGVGDRRYPAFYRSLLATAPSHRGRGLGKLLVEQAKHHFQEIVGQQGILYGYIEEENLRSLEVSRGVGYSPIGTFSVLLLTRFSPKHRCAIEQVAASECDSVVQGLETLYQDHALTNFEHSVRADDYYILRRANDIVAGIQAKRCRWTIERLPGIGGRILLGALSWESLARRLVDPQQYEFLRLGNAYVQPGYERDWFALVETVLAKQRLVSGMLFMDKCSPVYQRLISAGRFSWLNTITNISGRVMAGFKNVSEEEIAEIRRRPLCFPPTEM